MRVHALVLVLAGVGCGKIVAPTSSAVLVVRGTVTAGGVAKAAAVVRARSSPASDCSGGNPHLNAFGEAQTTADGGYQLTLPSTAGGLRCVRVVTYAGQPGASDSSFKSGLFATFKELPPPDTLMVHLQLP